MLHMISANESLELDVYRCSEKQITKFIGKHPWQSIFKQKAAKLRHTTLIKPDSAKGVFQM